MTGLGWSAPIGSSIDPVDRNWPWNLPGEEWPHPGKLAVVCAARLSEELRVIGVGAGRAGVHGGRGEPAQKLAYFLVIFGLAPLQIGGFQ